MAQQSPINPTSLNSFFKIQYAKKLARVVPNSAIVWKNTEVGDVERIGQKLITPVLLAPEQGLSFDVASGTATTNNPISMQITDATVNPPQMSIKSQLPIDTILRAQRDQDSFERATDLRFKEQKNSLLRNWEWSALYGQEPVFTENGATSSSGADVVVTLKTHAPGFIATLLNAQMDAFNGTTKINTNAVLNVKAISISASGTTTVTLSGNATDLAALADGYDYYRVGANLGGGSFAESLGLVSQLGLTSGSPFGISITANPGWKPNKLTSVGALTVAKLCDGVAACQTFGCDEDMAALVSPRNYSRLLQEQQLLVRYTGPTGTGGAANQGFKTYEVEQGGIGFKLISHPFMKDADYAILPLGEVTKVGTSDDVVTNVAGMDAIVFDHTTNSYYMTMYVAIQPFNQRPSWSARGTGVTIS